MIPSAPPPPRLKRFAVHAAFSYAKEDADYVRRVGDALPKGIKVHDYKTRDGILKVVGLDLKKTLKHIYQYEAMFVFAFISKAYAESEYAQIEWEAAKRAAKHKRGYLIPVRLEETDMVISQTWLDGTLPAAQVADLIEGAIRRPPPAEWWFYLSTQVKVAAAAALLTLVLSAYPIYLWLWPSRTWLKSADANVDGIIAHVVNDGPKSATIVGKRLKFGSLPIEDSELRLDKSESPTIAHGERDVKLITMALATKCGADGFLVNKRKVEPLLGQQPITLEIDIRESDDTPGKSRRRIVTFPAARLKPLVRRLVLGYETLCP
jgi:hypothetical protein